MCVDDVVRVGVELWRGCKGLKIEFFALSGRESSCESCEKLDITHPSVHMTQRFVIQGRPTLISISMMRLCCLITKSSVLQ